MLFDKQNRETEEYCSFYSFYYKSGYLFVFLKLSAPEVGSLLKPFF